MVTLRGEPAAYRNMLTAISSQPVCLCARAAIGVWVTHRHHRRRAGVEMAVLGRAERHVATRRRSLLRPEKLGKRQDFQGPGRFPPQSLTSYVERVSPSSRRNARTAQTAQGVDDLLVASNFIRAVRESGYLSLSTALAELIDNAIQANASTIDLTIERCAESGMVEIRVLDDGHGMVRGELEACLRFGGSSRFDDRRSFGRFGMGLPAASLSQARHVEVIAWQSGTAPQTVGLDVDDIAAGKPPALRARRVAMEPSTSAGCLVVWRRCDRIEYQRLAWLERLLHRDLGRIYRRFISAKTTLTINGAPIAPVDPLLCASRLVNGSGSLAFEPLRYQLETVSGATAEVVVRFSELPVQQWHQLDNLTKRRIGVVGGGGVSIVRAGREIAYGWHLMGGKRKENYDDWWRCEIEFEPSLDEHFGITSNKQGIRPSRQLREVLEPELESIARLMNSRVRQAFEDVKVQAAAQASCRVAEAADRYLPVVRSTGKSDDDRGLSYRISSAQLPAEQIFATTIRQRTLEVTLNVDHPAFTALYKPLLSAAPDDGGRDGVRTAVELMLLSFARTAAVLASDNRSQDDLISQWGATYSRMLQHI